MQFGVGSILEGFRRRRCCCCFICVNIVCVVSICVSDGKIEKTNGGVTCSVCVRVCV